MASVLCFEDLKVWQLARRINTKINPLIIKLREVREYRMAEQIRSSAGSIMDNIAEGFERNSKLEFINSLGIAKGENGELMSQLYRAADINYLTQDQFTEIYSDTKTLSKMI